MLKKNKVLSFAMKWYERFNNKSTNYIQLTESDMADDCFELGFEMDCGNAFFKKYGEAINDSIQLELIIQNVTDISLLGSAIFSKWRYFNHWAYNSTEILEHNNRRWFLIALNRLAELSK